MTALAITGLTGKSGSVFASLISENISEIERSFPGGLRFILRPTSKLSNIQRMLPNATSCIGELTDIEFLQHSFENVDTVFHIAGIHWSREVVEAASTCHVRRLIVVHTTGVYSKYKLAGEEYRQIDSFVYNTCQKKNIILTILRPTMIYGNTKDRNVIKFIKMVDRFPLMPVVKGANYKLQPVHFSDLGKAYYSVLMREDTTSNKEFVLSGGQPILLRDMLQEIGKNLGKRVRFISCPFWIAYSGAWVILVTTFGKIDSREKVQRLCENRAYSHDEATKAFGYDPMTFEEGIVQEVNDYKEGK